MLLLTGCLRSLLLGSQQPHHRDVDASVQQSVAGALGGDARVLMVGIEHIFARELTMTGTADVSVKKASPPMSARDAIGGRLAI